MMTKRSLSDAEGEERLSSEELAALIVDAFLHAGIVEPERVEEAIKIAVEEIDVRKVLGDY